MTEQQQQQQPHQQHRPAADRWRWVGPVLLIVLAVGLALQYARKAANDRSAFVRWRPQIQALVAQGENMYRVPDESGEREAEADPDTAYPNPPLLAILLYPLTLLPSLAGAMTFFVIKLVMVWFILRWCVELATGPGNRLPPLAAAAVLVVAARPIMGDLQHGNVNIVVFFVVAAGLWAFARGRDAGAGLLIALATAFKVTPALFIPYFAWKRQWKLVGASLVGLVLFLLVLPGLVLGMKRNVQLLNDWRIAMINPYLFDNRVEAAQHNQSLPGLVHRLLTKKGRILMKSGPHRRVNLAELDRRHAQWIVKGTSFCIVLWIAWLCRTSTNDRRDWRLACEYALVALATLFLSERTWKHHYVSIVLPAAAIAAHAALRETLPWRRAVLAASLVVSLLLMASTSTELGGWMAKGKLGHKYAQAYGAFLFSGFVLFGAVSWILLRARRQDSLGGVAAARDGDGPPAPRVSPFER